MQQQYGQQAQTDQILLLIPGSDEPSISVRQRDSLHQDIPCSDPQEEALPEEEAVEDFQGEVTPVEAAASQVEEDQEDQEDLQQILKEDIKETD